MLVRVLRIRAMWSGVFKNNGDWIIYMYCGNVKNECMEKSLLTWCAEICCKTKTWSNDRTWNSIIDKWFEFCCFSHQKEKKMLSVFTKFKVILSLTPQVHCASNKLVCTSSCQSECPCCHVQSEEPLCQPPAALPIFFKNVFSIVSLES